MNQTEQMKASMKPIKDQARAVGDELNQLGRVTRDQAYEGMNGIKDSAHHLVDSGLSKAKRLEQRAESMISARPFRATAIAAVAGVAVGVLLGRATRH